MFNLQKFLNRVAQFQYNETHAEDENNLCYLRVVKERLIQQEQRHEDVEVERFLTECGKQEQPESLLDQIVSFYGRKNEVEQDLNRQLGLNE